MKYIFKKWRSKSAVEPHASSYTGRILVLCAVAGIRDAGVVLPPRCSSPLYHPCILLPWSRTLRCGSLRQGWVALAAVCYAGVVVALVVPLLLVVAISSFLVLVSPLSPFPPSSRCRRCSSSCRHHRHRRCCSSCSRRRRLRRLRCSSGCCCWHRRYRQFFCCCSHRRRRRLCCCCWRRRRCRCYCCWRRRRPSSSLRLLVVLGSRVISRGK